MAKSRAASHPEPSTPGSRLSLRESSAPSQSEGTKRRAFRGAKGDYPDAQRAAVDKLLPEIYDSLRRIAHRYMRSEAQEHTLQPTALVHEAVLHAVEREHLSVAGKTHLLAICARDMRRILVDRARRRAALKRGGARYRVPLVDDLIGSGSDGQDLLVLDETLAKLAALDPQQAELVELRVFGGLTVAEAAQAMGLAKRTAEREWTFAKAWLRRELAVDAS